MSCASPLGLGGCRLPRAVVVLVSVVLLTSCFEEPVAEKLTIRFESDGMVTVAVETAIADPGKEANPALTKRLAELRRALEQGSDPWTRSFELLAPDSEKVSFEREHGRLVRVERSGRLADHERLRLFLAEIGVTAALRLVEREMTLEIVPAGNLRASRAQRDQIHGLLSTWSDAVARTYAATRALYDYLGDHPDRGPACLSAVFTEALPTADQRPGRDLSEADHVLVDPLREARREVLAIFEAPDDQAFSLNELSHLVYDPFPARLVVQVPSEPSELEGFQISPDGSLAIAGLGLYEAMQTLGGVWALPDPLVTYVEAARGHGRLTLAGLAAVPLSAAAPGATDVREALAARLRPAPLYRVVFRFTAGEDAEGPAPSGERP